MKNITSDHQLPRDVMGEGGSSGEPGVDAGPGDGKGADGIMEYPEAKAEGLSASVAEENVDQDEADGGSRGVTVKAKIEFVELMGVGTEAFVAASYSGDEDEVRCCVLHLRCLDVLQSDTLTFLHRLSLPRMKM